jgi:5'-methylthioadenosine phosphorylase
MADIKIGLIGGTGLADALGNHGGTHRHERQTLETPFGLPSDAIVETDWDGLPVFMLARHGPGHLLNPSQVPYRANLFALKKLGCTHIIASGAVGSLRDEFRPRDLVVPDQIIDKTCKRANTFFDGAAVHVEFAEPFCPVLRQILLEAGREFAAGRRAQAGGEQAREATTASEPPLTVHERGCYVCMEGPAFSTRAESLMHRLWGGDLIGMTAMPEARLAREAELSYALVALVTDYDCWRIKPAGGPPGAAHDAMALLQEIIAHLQAATASAMSVMRAAVGLIARQADSLPPSPAHSALKLGIWSDKTRIPPDEVKRLGPLWMKYFG